MKDDVAGEMIDDVPPLLPLRDEVERCLAARQSAYSAVRVWAAEEARAVAAGTGERFAAWSVEARAPDQLLMCDLYGRTRSWFMVEPATDAGPVQTRLYFGSAVVASAMRKPSFRLLLGFHVLYSKALLRAARRRLRR